MHHSTHASNNFGGRLKSLRRIPAITVAASLLVVGAFVCIAWFSPFTSFIVAALAVVEYQARADMRSAQQGRSTPHGGRFIGLLSLIGDDDGYDHERDEYGFHSRCDL
jgi:hypothetical protein